MGDAEPLADGELPPPRGKRRRVPDRLSPHLRVWLTRMARLGARTTWCIELFYKPTQGGQGELCQRARDGDPTLLLDTAREVQWRATQLADDIERAMASQPTLARPGTSAKVEIMRTRHTSRQALFADGDAPL